MNERIAQLEKEILERQDTQAEQEEILTLMQDHGACSWAAAYSVVGLDPTLGVMPFSQRYLGYQRTTTQCFIM